MTISLHPEREAAIPGPLNLSTGALTLFGSSSQIPVDRPSTISITQTLSLSSDELLRRRFLLSHQPVKANFRFGLLLEVLDKLAEDTALAHVWRFHPEARVVTAAIDSIRVRCAPDVNRDMVLRSRVNYIGKSSLEVGVRVEQPGDPSAHIASCYLPAVVTVNRINFHHPMRRGYKLNFISRVAYTGNSPICVETDIVRISSDRSTTALCNTCVFTFVNVDSDFKPQPVPQIYPTTYAEDGRYLAAYRRRAAYLGG